MDKAYLSEEAANALGCPELAGKLVEYQTTYPKLWKGVKGAINIKHDGTMLTNSFAVIGTQIVVFKPEMVKDQ